MRIPLLALALACSTFGCAHEFRTQRVDITGDGIALAGTPIDGVVFYLPRYVEVTYEFTALVSKDGVHRGTGCVPTIQKQEIQLLPDLTQPYALLNDPSAFASGSTSVTLSNGMIATVNGTSNPELSETIQAMSGLVATVAPLAMLDVPPGGGTPACNAAPRITRFTPRSLD